jgi:hypothetical protein
MLRRLLRRQIRLLAEGAWSRPEPARSGDLIGTYCHDTVLTVPVASHDDALVRSVGEAVTRIVLSPGDADAADRAARVRRELAAYQRGLRNEARG